jgi:hypothetical protein
MMPPLASRVIEVIRRRKRTITLVPRAHTRIDEIDQLRRGNGPLKTNNPLFKSLIRFANQAEFFFQRVALTLLSSR